MAKDREEDGPSTGAQAGAGTLYHPTAVGPDPPVETYAMSGRTVRSSLGDASSVGAGHVDVALPDPGLRPVRRPGDALPLPEGLVYEGLLGMGAMGEVHRVRDVALNRTMALKVLQPEFASREASTQRFLDEAQASAQLRHPGIVPVHTMGVLSDGRVYFTMQEVRGRTLGAVVGALHLASGPDGWRAGSQGTTFRRVVDHLRVASEAVGHAHRRGVVHRDLKPANIMVGDHGEVLVMDWGLAKVIGRDELPVDEVVVTTGRAEATRAGVVFGTPAYMPPEQARGLIDQLDARTDVYALGAILFAILYGERPYRGLSTKSLLGRVAAGIVPTPPEGGPPVPEELEDIRRRAMSPDPDRRFPDGSALAEAIVAWLDGAARREQALRLVWLAAEQGPRAARLRARAAQERATSESILEGVEAWAGEADKAPAWEALDRADALDAEAELLDVEAEQLLQGALSHDPDCVEAHEALADRFYQAHAQAELRRDATAARRAEALLRSRVAALPPANAARIRHEAWLSGLGRLTLQTDPPGVPVTLHRYEQRRRRLVPVRVRDLGTTPLEGVPLEHGSYLLVLQAPGGEVRLPLRLARQEHVDFVRPDGASSLLRLPRQGELTSEDVFVAEGWAWLGGDPSAIGSGPLVHRWVPSFVMRRFPVTNAEYVAFLDDLVAQGREHEALAHVPRERGGTVGEIGSMIFGRCEDGTFFLRPDADGDEWGPENPVVNISWFGAEAYANWLSERSGLPWRLPTSDEWEKAGRGVDGRFFPWGDALDPSWCCMRDSHPGRPIFADVHEFPVDESPYGVRGLAGNVRDWCADEVADGRKVDRGGFWLGNAREARLADSHQHNPSHRAGEIGFRLARSLPD